MKVTWCKFSHNRPFSFFTFLTKSLSKNCSLTAWNRSAMALFSHIGLIRQICFKQANIELDLFTPSSSLSSSVKVSAAASVNDSSRVFAMWSNIMYWCSRGAGTARGSAVCLRNNTPIAAAMCVLIKWLGSPRSFANSLHKERGPHSFAAEKQLL